MRKIYAPMLDDVWAVGKIDYDDVLNCPSLELGSIPHSKIFDDLYYTHEYHTARIAWLGAHGWEEDAEENIEVCLENGEIYLSDGNHRFSAALVFHETVTFDFYGDLDQFQQILTMAVSS
ncbi:MAG: hypothetical protein H9W81_13680 [Enterococcus sp.]|nr:hypothetical protein [Enterococcus sp.]